MKKYIVSSVAFLASALIAGATSLTITGLNPLQATNFISGPCKVTQFIVSANSTNVAVKFVDAPTATNWTYSVSAYTNTLSYATNLVYSYTNYWGAVTTLTNLQLVDTTVLVPATNYTYATRVQVDALAGTSTTLQSVNYYFINGCQVTNTSSGIAAITATYQSLGN